MKEFTHQIKRMTRDWYNYVEPPKLATVQSVNGNLVDITLSDGIPIPNVPILQTGSSLILNTNDTVLVIFIGGHIGNPIIIGKV